MEIRESKNYLKQVSWCEMRVRAKLSQLEQLHQLMLEAGGSDKTMAKIAALQEEIDRDVNELVDRKREILLLIRRVPDLRYRTLLELRYLQMWTWEKVAANMKYSESHIMQLSNESLEAFGKILEEERKKEGSGVLGSVTMENGNCHSHHLLP